MMTKAEMREFLEAELADMDVDDADEIADALVDRMDENGAFESDEEDE